MKWHRVGWRPPPPPSRHVGGSYPSRCVSVPHGLLSVVAAPCRSVASFGSPPPPHSGLFVGKAFILNNDTGEQSRTVLERGARVRSWIGAQGVHRGVVREGVRGLVDWCSGYTVDWWRGTPVDWHSLWIGTGRGLARPWICTARGLASATPPPSEVRLLTSRVTRGTRPGEPAPPRSSCAR